MTSKDAVRKEARARLRTVSSESAAGAGAEINRNLWQLPELASARAILLYASLPGEVPTESIAAEARRRGIEVTYPRCLVEERRLSLHRVRHEEELVPDNRWGIREPPLECPLVTMEEIDVAIIPGLGWDRAGNRLGRGAGYYDRLLSSPEWRAVRCGVFFGWQEFPAIPVDPWDVQLDLVVTEKEVLRIS